MCWLVNYWKRKDLISIRHLVGFIYSHSRSLSLLRQCTNKRKFVRHVVTSFATSYLSLKRLHQREGKFEKDVHFKLMEQEQDV